MAARNELVYDEDDYVPPGYVPPKPKSGRRKPLVAVVVVGLIVGAFAVVFLTRSRERARFARVERARAAQSAAIEAGRIGGIRQLGMGPAGDDFPARPSEAWSRIVGTWSRMPDPDEENTYPVRFDIREDQRATVTYPDATRREVRMRITSEGQDSIVMEALPLEADPDSGTFLMGRFRFSFRPDNTIALDSHMGGPIFAREVANPARLGMPPR